MKRNGSAFQEEETEEIEPYVETGSQSTGHATRMT